MRLTIALALALLAGSPALAEAPTPEALRNAKNADVLLSKYPRRALAAGEQGSVYFRVKLDRDGQPLSCEIVQGSGHPLLDRETCDLILIHAVFKPVKDAAGSKISPTHEGVVNWRLPPGATISAVAAVATAPRAAAAEKKICKRTVRTGTLAGYERTCMTKREWQRASDESKEPFDELQGRKGFTNGVPSGPPGT